MDGEPFTPTHPAPDPTVPDAVFAKIRERMVGLARHFGCRRDAEDVAQETMFELSRRYSAVSDPEDLIKLANKICFYKARNARRGRRQEASAVGAYQEKSLEPDPERMVLDEELHQRVRQALARCSGRCKSLFLLDMQHAGTEVICREMNLSRPALFTLRSRCVAELRKVWP